MVASSLAVGRYISWGVIQISLTNLLILVGMIVLFIAALVLPFPGSHSGDAKQGSHDDEH